MDELLKLQADTTTSLDCTFCCNSSSHPSIPCYHYSLSYSVTGHFSRLFCLFLCQLHPHCTGVKEAVCTMWQVARTWVPLSGPVLLVSFLTRKRGDSDWLCAWQIDAAFLVGLANQCLCMNKLLSQSTWWYFSASKESGSFLVGYILVP